MPKVDKKILAVPSVGERVEFSAKFKSKNQTMQQLFLSPQQSKLLFHSKVYF